jgi:hypothetical protein
MSVSQSFAAADKTETSLRQLLAMEQTVHTRLQNARAISH